MGKKDGTYVKSMRKLHERINLGIGVKFQAPSVFSELTVLENLSLANNRENSLKISDLLNDFDLNKDKNNLAGDLSHGKKPPPEGGGITARMRVCTLVVLIDVKYLDMLRRNVTPSSFSSIGAVPSSL